MISWLKINPKIWLIQSNRKVALVESLILPALFFTSAVFLSPHGGESFYHSTEWLWLAPIFIALRYGAGLGGLAWLVIVIAMAFVIVPPPWYYPQSFYALEGLFITLLCGQFRSIWHEKLTRSNQLLHYAQQRLEFLSRVYFMTRISHDRMEQSLIGKPVTIRSALIDLRMMIVEHGSTLTPEIAKLLLQLLSQACSFERAGIFIVENGCVSPDCIADVGKFGRLNIEDILVSGALRRNEMTYLAVNQISEKDVSQYLVVAPMKPSEADIFALVVVERMPFLSLNQDNLKAMSVLLNYFSEDYYAVISAKHVIAAYPDCSSDFAVELIKLNYLHQSVGIDSCIVALFVSNKQKYQSIIPALQLQQRGLDLAWVHKTTGQSILITLMPVSELMSVEGYVRRIRQWLKEERGLSFSYPNLHIHYCRIGDGEPVALLQGLIDGPNQD